MSQGVKGQLRKSRKIIEIVEKPNGLWATEKVLKKGEAELKNNHVDSGKPNYNPELEQDSAEHSEIKP